MELNEANNVLNTTVEAKENKTIHESFVNVYRIEDIDSTSLTMPKKATRKDVGRE